MAARRAEELMRAREVHHEALNELHAKINACKESMHNYDCLSNRISTLPEKLSHEVMVPFGKLAFMPGRLEHTNELLVHLGDRWFSEMTTKTALKIIEERQQNLTSTLQDLEKVRKNIENKSEYLSEMEEAAKGMSGEFEIKEECPSFYTHPKDRRRVSRVKDSASTAGGKKQEKEEADASESDLDAQDALMRRLDELERQEEEEDELYRISTDDDIEVKDGSGSPNVEKTKTKCVRWKDGGGERLDKNPATNTPECCTIRFRHSKVQPTYTDGCMTPRDVGKLVHGRAAGKSILKKTQQLKEIKAHAGLALPKGHGLDSTPALVEDNPLQFQEQAITDTVVERTTSTHEKQTADPAPARPVSRFKASRQKQS